MVKREKANYMIQSVSHAMDVLEELAQARGEVGVTELSKRLKLHKNNVFRLLATLELRGYVEQNPDTEDYRLGPKCLELGQSYVAQSTLVERAMPIIKKLADEIGETVSFAVLQNGTVQYPISITSKRPVKVAPRLATSFPAKLCAVGRLLTAQLPDSVLTELLAGNTAQDAAIKSQLGELRSTGIVVDPGGTEADVVCVSRVVKGNQDTVPGAIEVLIPQYRAKVEDIHEHLSEAAAKLSESLGAGAARGLASSLEKDVVSAGMVAN